MILSSFFRWRAVALIFVILALHACQVTKLGPSYSEKAYSNATTLKARSVALIDLSSQPYAQHSAAATQLSTDISAALEFSKGQPRNEVATNQWALMRDPEKNLIGGYLKHWQGPGAEGVSEFFRSEARGKIEQAYDYIICLEVNKREGKTCTAPATGG